MIQKIIETAFKHKLFMLIAMLGICGAGAYAYQQLPVDAFPDVSPNMVLVFAETPGLAAEEVELFITRPVENTMTGIPGVKKVRSISSHGLSTVKIYFDESIDIYFAHQQVAERMKLAEEGIPKSVNLPHGLEKSPVLSGMGKILTYYFKSDKHSITELRELQDQVVKRQLKGINGVAKILSQGGYVLQYQVKILPHKLLKYNLTPDDVVDAVEQNNANHGAGLIKRNDEELMVRTLGLLRGTDDIKNLVLKTHNGSPVFVKDVADVTKGNAFRRGVVTKDGGKEIVVGDIYKLHGANSFAVIKKIKARLKEINKTLPEGVELIPFYDQSKLVKNSIATVQSALTLGLILVCIISFIFLGNIRNTIIMLCSLPFSVLLAITMMNYYQIPADLISFGGVAIALGMIVDATIIMVEKIQTSIQKKAGESYSKIILEAAKEVGPPILIATMIIIIVFIPLFSLQGVEGKMFRPLAFTVTITMAGSLIYALLIAPVLYRLLHRDSKAEQKKSIILEKSQSIYRTILKCILKNATIVIICTLALIGFGISLFNSLGKEFVPTLKEGAIQILVHMDPNVALDKISSTIADMEKDVIDVPGVKSIVTEIGYGEVGPHVHHTNYGCVTVVLKNRDERTVHKTHEQILEAISKRLAKIPGVSINYSQPIQHEVDGLIAGAGTQVVAKISGTEFEVLQDKAAEIQKQLEKIKGVADLRTEQFSGQTQLQILFKDKVLAQHGLNRSDVQKTIANAIGGKLVGSILKGERSYGINVRFHEDYRKTAEQFKQMLIRAKDGYLVPLRQLAEIKFVTGLRQVSRENGRRYISVQCNVRGRDPGTFVEDAQKAVDANVKLPPGYNIIWGGQFELQQAANKRLMIIVPITLLLVVLMLYSLFSSGWNVFLILLNVPLSLVGGIAFLKLFGENVSIPSSIGFIALLGIALTDGLVLVSRFEFLRNEKKLSLEDAVLEGAVSKLRPVIMTTLTTALGLIPLIFSNGVGSEIQRPLAIVVVGGLSSSTLLTLIVLPVLYLMMNKWRGQSKVVETPEEHSHKTIPVPAAIEA